MPYYPDVPDHPVVANLLRTGTPNGTEPEYPHCPVCGAKEIGEALIQDSEIIGCDSCCDFKFPEDIKNLSLKPDADGWVHCPACGRPAETLLVKTRTGQVLGCDECARPHDAWEEPGCFFRRD